MASLSNLSDQQNMLLTQLSYESDVFKDNYEDLSLEQILLVVTDKKAKAKVRELCDAGLGSLRIKAVGNDPATGFGAIAFMDEHGNTGFSFRGTDGMKVESLNDWGDNITAMATGTSPQTAQAESFFDQYSDPSGNNYLYGHSKGGNLSESVYVNNYSNIKEVHLLNPQPINPYSLTPDQRAAMESSKVDIVIVEGDYVWFLGKLPSYGNIRIIKGNGKNPHVYESIRDMYDADGNIIPGKMPVWEYAAYFGISHLLAGVQQTWGGIGFVYSCTARVVDYVRDELIPKAKEFVAWVADKVEKFGSKLKTFASDLKNFLTDTVNRAKKWFKENLNAGYKYASANPQIVVDTNKLRGYAQRLQAVNRRVSRLDGRLDALYGKVGLLDLWNLLQADLLTGYSGRINRCVTYLNETATDFENVEAVLLKNL